MKADELDRARALAERLLNRLGRGPKIEDARLLARAFLDRELLNEHDLD